MKATDHSREAQSLLLSATDNMRPVDVESDRNTLLAALVHAQLAHTMTLQDLAFPVRVVGPVSD